MAAFYLVVAACVLISSVMSQNGGDLLLSTEPVFGVSEDNVGLTIPNGEVSVSLTDETFIDQATPTFGNTTEQDTNTLANNEATTDTLSRDTNSLTPDITSLLTTVVTENTAYGYSSKSFEQELTTMLPTSTEGASQLGTLTKSVTGNAVESSSSISNTHSLQMTSNEAVTTNENLIFDTSSQSYKTGFVSSTVSEIFTSKQSGISQQPDFTTANRQLNSESSEFISTTSANNSIFTTQVFEAISSSVNAGSGLSTETKIAYVTDLFNRSTANDAVAVTKQPETEFSTNPAQSSAATTVNNYLTTIIQVDSKTTSAVIGELVSTVGLPSSISYVTKSVTSAALESISAEVSTVPIGQIEVTSAVISNSNTQIMKTQTETVVSTNSVENSSTKASKTTNFSEQTFVTASSETLPLGSTKEISATVQTEQSLSSIPAQQTQHLTVFTTGSAVTLTSQPIASSESAATPSEQPIASSQSAATPTGQPKTETQTVTMPAGQSITTMLLFASTTQYQSSSFTTTQNSAATSSVLQAVSTQQAAGVTGLILTTLLQSSTTYAFTNRTSQYQSTRTNNAQPSQSVGSQATTIIGSASNQTTATSATGAFGITTAPPSANDLTISLAVGLCVGVGGLIIIIVITVCCLRNQSAARQHMNMRQVNHQPAQEVSRADWLPLSRADTFSGTYGRYKSTGEGYKATDLESGYNTVASRGIESTTAADNDAYIEDDTGNRHQYRSL